MEWNWDTAVEKYGVEDSFGLLILIFKYAVQTLKMPKYPKNIFSPTFSGFNLSAVTSR